MKLRKRLFGCTAAWRSPRFRWMDSFRFAQPTNSTNDGGDERWSDTCEGGDERLALETGISCPVPMHAWSSSFPLSILSNPNSSSPRPGGCRRLQAAQHEYAPAPAQFGFLCFKHSFAIPFCPRSIFIPVLVRCCVNCPTTLEICRSSDNQDTQTGAAWRVWGHDLQNIQPQSGRPKRRNADGRRRCYCCC